MSLPPPDIELLKLEVPLLEQRVAQLENVQYRLRQFSLTLWVVLLSVGMGVTGNIEPRVFLVMMGILAPAMFMILDATYAQHAQSIRARRDWVIEYLNASTDVQHGGQSGRVPPLRPIPRLDLTGRLTTWSDPQTRYRKSLVVKLTRRVRMGFYGLQIILSTGILSNELARRSESLQLEYYLLVPVVPAIFAALLAFRRYKRRRIVSALPEGYDRPIDTRADGPGDPCRTREALH